jgi:hypothetical protein
MKSCYGLFPLFLFSLVFLPAAVEAFVPQEAFRDSEPGGIIIVMDATNTAALESRNE